MHTNHKGESMTKKRNKRWKLIKILLEAIELLIFMIIGIGAIITYHIGILPEKNIISIILLMLCALAIHFIIYVYKILSKIEEVSEAQNKDLAELKKKIPIEVTPSKETNYKRVLDEVLAAETVFTTHFIPYGIGGLRTENVKLIQDELIKNTNNRIRAGQLIWRQLNTVNNKEKFDEILEDIKNFFLGKEGRDILKQGTFLIKIVPYNIEGYFPQIDLIIFEKKDGLKTAVIGIPTHYEDISSGLYIKEKKLVSDLMYHFNQMWDRSIPIVDHNKIYIEKIKKIGAHFYDKQDKKFQEIEELAQINLKK